MYCRNWNSFGRLFSNFRKISTDFEAENVNNDHDFLYILYLKADDNIYKNRFHPLVSRIDLQNINEVFRIVKGYIIGGLVMSWFLLFCFFRICNSKSILKERTFFVWRPQEEKFSNKWTMEALEVFGFWKLFFSFGSNRRTYNTQ